jgi:uncharacterized protein DUF4136
MLFERIVRAKPALLASAAALCVFALGGCDEHVRIVRDPDLRIARHATWAWQPMKERQGAERGSRPVVSRDEIGRRESATVTRDRDAENDVLRGKVKTAIEQTLMAKGMKEVSDPAAADYLVDFHLGVHRRNVTVQNVYPGYPGLVCGPFGCWEGWGPPMVGYERIRFREGSIVVDLAQQSTNHVVYRAIAEKPVRRDMLSFSQDEVNSIVSHLFRDLRVGKK